MANKLLEAALRYAKYGILVLPLVPAGKAPLTKHGRNDATTDTDIIRGWWEQWPNANVGLRTGAESGFFVVDIDGAAGELSLEALEMGNGQLPDTRQSLTGRSGGIHMFFKHPGSKVQSFNDGRLGTNLDVLGDGAHIVAPPSIHKNGVGYAWDGDPPSKINAAPKWFLDKLARGKRARVSSVENQANGDAKIREGERHGELVSLAGKLRHAGLNYPEILAGLVGFNEQRCDPPKSLEDLEKIAQYAATQWERGETRAPADSVWPGLQQLPARVSVVPCNVEMLPPVIAHWALDLAERASVPIDLPVAAVIVCLSAAIGRRVRVQPKRNDSRFLVTPNLWGVMIASPGSKKSYVITEAKRSLQQIDRCWRLEFEANKGRYDAELATFKKKPSSSGDTERECPIEPKRRRALVNDATAEAMHEVLSANPGGVLVLRDELPGWLEVLDKPGREGDRGFWLETWGGDGTYNSVRIARGSTDADALCVSLFGGVQPGPWMAYVARAPDDGMVQRFQVIVYPDPLPRVKTVDRAPDQEAEARIAALFERLVAMPAEPYLLLQFSNDAQQLHDEWLQALEDTVAQGGDRPALTNHRAKYCSLMPSLACIFELVESESPQSIGIEATRRAAAFCEYLDSHAVRSYGARSESGLQAARSLAAKLKAGAIGGDGQFSLREVYRPGWGGLASKPEAKAACEILMDYDWIRRLGASRALGRPSTVFEVNPEVRP